MAPSFEEPMLRHATVTSEKHGSPIKTDRPRRAYKPGHIIPEKHNYTYEHEDMKPYFPDVQWPELEEVPYYDRGLKGHAQFENLLGAASDGFDYNPKSGQKFAKDDLARLIAIRGAVFFRGQDDFDIIAQRDLMKHFGTLHKHATTSVPTRPGCEDVHVAYTAEDARDMRAFFAPSFLWHSDYAGYDAISPPMQTYLESLTALHSAQMQADGARALGRTVRREPILTEHPLVRTHPVTGWKALFFNPGFVTKIVGVPKAESDAIVRYLNEVIVTTQEFHVRFQWGKNDVAFWDNRICNHIAFYGFTGHRRHAVRVGCHGERPVLDPAVRSQEEELQQLYGVPKVCKDGCGVVNYND